MPPSNLHGLNIIHPQSQDSPSSSSLDLTTSSFPDLSAQLDLWTNLAFHSDEPIGSNDDDYLNGSKKALSDDLDDDEDTFARDGVALHEGHVNVITGRQMPAKPKLKNGGRNSNNLRNSLAIRNIQDENSNTVASSSSNNNNSASAPSVSTSSGTVITGPNSSLPPAPAAFDLSTLLAGFGIDPNSLPPPTQQSPFPTIAPSLAQLIALHTAQTAAATFSAPTQQQAHQTGGVHPLFPISPLAHTQSRLESSTLPASSSPSPSTSTSSIQPPSKRARTRKSSVSSSTLDPPDHHLLQDAQSAPHSLLPAPAHNTSTIPAPNTSTPVSVSEDKRRRNTAASARFRLKKKEREAALEQKAKELEGRVNELERECEGLRRENGWLKGLVVGVTGAGAASQNHQMAAIGGTKRSRDDSAEGSGS